MMTRAEVAKKLNMKPCKVESIERTAIKKILRNRGLCQKCVDILEKLDSLPVEADWYVPEVPDVEEVQETA